MTRWHEARARRTIFLLVFLSHCALIFIISRSNTAQKPAAQTRHEPLVVFFLDSIKGKTEADATEEPSPVKARTILKRQNAVPPTNLSKPTEPDVMSSNAITDWYAQVHSVAEDVLNKDGSKGAKHAFEHKMPSTQERGKPSIFDPAPVRRAGTWDDPDRFYVTDNCYYEYDKAPRPPPTLLDNRLKTPVCKRPPKGGGDAMFKDLTPDYLKTLPEPKNP